MTTEISEPEIAVPGNHYVWVENPLGKGGRSNIREFLVTDTGQSFHLSFNPLFLRVIKGNVERSDLIVMNLSSGLNSFNITIQKDYDTPFSYYISNFSAGVYDPQIIILSADMVTITGKYSSRWTGDESVSIPLVTISVIGVRSGSGQIHCTLNSAEAGDGSHYGRGYTALPVTVGDIISIMNPAGSSYQVPTDPDLDGLYEDVNGNQRFDLADVVLFYNSIDFIVNNEPIWIFDFDGME